VDPRPPAPGRFLSHSEKKTVIGEKDIERGFSPGREGFSLLARKRKRHHFYNISYGKKKKRYPGKGGWAVSFFYDRRKKKGVYLA